MLLTRLNGVLLRISFRMCVFYEDGEQCAGVPSEVGGLMQ